MIQLSASARSASVCFDAHQRRGEHRRAPARCSDAHRRVPASTPSTAPLLIDSLAIRRPQVCRQIDVVPAAMIVVCDQGSRARRRANMVEATRLIRPRRGEREVPTILLRRAGMRSSSRGSCGSKSSWNRGWARSRRIACVARTIAWQPIVGDQRGNHVARVVPRRSRRGDQQTAASATNQRFSQRTPRAF